MRWLKKGIGFENGDLIAKIMLIFMVKLFKIEGQKDGTLFEDEFSSSFPSSF